jgi:hypothetical protein
VNRSNVIYRACSDINQQAELSAVANVYRFILDCSAKRTTSRQSRRDNAILRNTEGVSHVDRRPD